MSRSIAVMAWLGGNPETETELVGSLSRMSAIAMMMWFALIAFQVIRGFYRMFFCQYRKELSKQHSELGQRLRKEVGAFQAVRIMTQGAANKEEQVDNMIAHFKRNDEFEESNKRINS